MKIHLFNSPSPMVEGRDTKAACGKTVRKAVPVYFVDYSYYDGMFTLTGMCSKCRQKETTKRYLYGVVNGDEALLEKSLEV